MVNIKGRGEMQRKCLLITFSSQEPVAIIPPILPEYHLNIPFFSSNCDFDKTGIGFATQTV